MGTAKKTREAEKAVRLTKKREDHYLGRIKQHGRDYAEFHRPSVEMMINLVYTHDVIHSYLARHVEAEGLSTGAFSALLIVSRSDAEGCPMHEIGELLLVSRANITGLVECLARRGLVERSEHKQDRRVRLVRLTAKGRKYLESVLPAHYARIREMFGGFSDREKDALSKKLMKLRHSVQLTLQTDPKPVSRSKKDKPKGVSR
jgi:DNA-binding MarR family transcriptional regulator